MTTTDQLFRLASDESAAADPATKEALRCRTALWYGARGWLGDRSARSAAMPRAWMSTRLQMVSARSRACVLVETPAGREKLFVHRALLELLASESHVAPPYGALGAR